VKVNFYQNKSDNCRYFGMVKNPACKRTVYFKDQLFFGASRPYCVSFPSFNFEVYFRKLETYVFDLSDEKSDDALIVRTKYGNCLRLPNCAYDNNGYVCLGYDIKIEESDPVVLCKKVIDQFWELGFTNNFALFNGTGDVYARAEETEIERTKFYNDLRKGKICVYKVAEVSEDEQETYKSLKSLANL